MLNDSEDQGKTLTIDYDSTIVELSKSSFTLPKTKDASESFTVKTKKNQAFSLTPKIESKSFKKRDFSATKDILAPTEAQLTLEEFTPKLTGGGAFPSKQAYSLEFFKDKFYVFPRNDEGKYYSSSDGETWKDEGKPHDDYPKVGGIPYTFVFENKLWATNELEKNFYSAETPDGTNFKELVPTKLYNNNYNLFTVFENKIWEYSLNNIESSIDGRVWKSALRIIDKSKFLKQASMLSYEGKIWSFGGQNGDGNAAELTSKVFSYDGTNLVKESDLPKPVQYTGAEIFANGFLVMGGFVKAPGTSDIYWSAYGKQWQKVNTTNKLDALQGLIFGGTTLKSKNEMWIVKRTTGGDPRVYKITFDPTK